MDIEFIGVRIFRQLGLLFWGYYDKDCSIVWWIQGPLAMGMVVRQHPISSAATTQHARFLRHTVDMLLAGDAAAADRRSSFSLRCPFGAP